MLEEDLGVEGNPPAWKQIHLGCGVLLVLHGWNGIPP